MRFAFAAVVALAVLAVACSSPGSEEPSVGVAPGNGTTPAPTTPPGLRVETVVAGLEHGWDIGFLPDGRALVTERPGRIQLLDRISPGATATEVRADLGSVYVHGEGGLMSLVVHPDFAQSRRFTTCQTHQQGGDPVDVRLVTWELAPDGTSARKVTDPLLGGLPVNPSGRHSGCRPTLGPDGALYVGTGDTARGNVPQDRTILGGKVLRIDLATGDPLPGNPFLRSANPNERLVYTYGHRNVQGVAVRPGTGQVFSAEHGPDEEDEVNLLRPGGNYGWDPAQGGTVGGYDEDVPMTDLVRFPNAVPAVWSSGPRREAISGAAFVEGEQWGALAGRLAVVALRGQKMLLMTLAEDGTVTQVGVPAELDGTHGRLRAVRSGPDGALYVTTSNGEDDEVLRISPA